MTGRREPLRLAGAVGRESREVAPLRFVDESGGRRTGFRQDASGNVAPVSDGRRVLERAPAMVPRPS
jgi:hypothetical protein